MTKQTTPLAGALGRLGGASGGQDTSAPRLGAHLWVAASASRNRAKVLDMMLRKLLLVMGMTAVATFGTSSLVASTAEAAPASTIHTYNWCQPGDCPSGIVWTINFTTRTLHDNYGNSGRFTMFNGVYTFVLKPENCTLKGRMTSLGFNTPTRPGTETCGVGPHLPWYAVKIL
jgi:hypothetical protein